MLTKVNPRDKKKLAVLAAEGATLSLRRRAAIIMLGDEGKNVKEIADSVGLAPSRVQYWLRRYRQIGLDIFEPTAPAKQAAAPAKQAAAPAKQAAAPAKQAAAPAKQAAAPAKQALPPLMPLPDEELNLRAAKTPVSSVEKAKSVEEIPTYTKKMRKVAMRAMKVVHDKKGLKRAKKIKTVEGFETFMDEVAGLGKSLRAAVKGDKLKKNKIRRLKKQVKQLDKLLKRARKLLK